MEIKKSYKADLERGYKARFLIGLAIALVSLLAALEINISDNEFSDEELLEDIPEELEMELTQQPKEDDPPQVILIEKEKPTLSDKLNVVDEEIIDETQREEADNIDITSEPLDKDASIDKEVPAESDDPLQILIVEELPEFPGGMTEFMKWLTKNLRYPAEAAKQKIQGKVLVSFIVNKDGTISDIKQENQVNPLLDREAIRVIRMMPKWKPGKDKGKVCRTMIVVPVVFAI